MYTVCILMLLVVTLANGNKQNNDELSNNKTETRNSETATVPAYCDWKYFYKKYVDKGNSARRKMIDENILKNYQEICGTEDHGCLRDGETFWNYGSLNKGHDRQYQRFGFHFTEWGKGCEYYYYELRNKNGDLIFDRFYDESMLPHKNNNTGQSIVVESLLFGKDTFNQVMTTTLYGFPGGTLIHTKKTTTPTDSCEKHTVFVATRYWFEREKEKSEQYAVLKTEENKSCQLYVQENFQVFAEFFCREMNYPSLKFISTNTPKYIRITDCQIYFNYVDSEKKYGSIYLWFLAPLFVFMVLFIVIKFYRKKLRKGSSEETFSSSTTPLHSIETEGDEVLPDSNISVMILHRPGCDILDSIVRDLLFVIKSHDIEVQSPLLEMSNIDAEGGVATFMQRNIHQYTYIIILVTDTVKDTTHVKHKPFEFTLKMLSGLSFQQNQCSRYIPVYLKDFKNVLSHIPLFLVAGKNQGYKIPQQIKDLIVFMKKTSEHNLSKEHLCRLNFFIERIKSQSSRYCTEKHANCCKERCFQGILKEDVSELWSESCSVVTRQHCSDKLSEACKLSITNLSSLEKVQEWRNDTCLITAPD